MFGNKLNLSAKGDAFVVASGSKNKALIKIVSTSSTHLNEDAPQKFTVSGSGVSPLTTEGNINTSTGVVEVEFISNVDSEDSNGKLEVVFDLIVCTDDACMRKKAKASFEVAKGSDQNVTKDLTLTLQA